jgi:transcriptional regulator with XRE-family HTH domain
MAGKKQTPPPTDWTPDRIRRLCESLGWTQARLATETGVALRNVQAWVSGEHNVSRLGGKVLDAIEANHKGDAK